MRAWAWSLAVGVVGCGGAPVAEAPVGGVDEAPTAPVAPPAEIVTLVDQTITGQTSTVRMQVLRAEATRTDTGWTIMARLSFLNGRAIGFNGLSQDGRSVLVKVRDLALHAGPEVLEPLSVVQSTTAVDDTVVVVPSLTPRRVGVEVSWELVGDDIPEDLAIRVPVEGGTAVAWLRGRPRTEDGDAAVEVQPVGVDGRPLDGAGAVQVGDVRVHVPAQGWPVTVPVGSLMVTVEGAEMVALEVAADGPALLTPRLVSEDMRDEVAYADVFGALEVPAVRGIDDLLPLFDTPEDVARYVRDHLAVLGSRGLARSPDAVVRLGAGSPVERALVARELMGRMGFQTRFTCGDLPEEEARALYGSVVAPDPVPAPLTSWVAEARAQMDAMVPGLDTALAGWAERPLGYRERVHHLPEWCWMGAREDTEDPTTPYQPYDLRPGDPTARPLPFPWRSETQIAGDAWRYGITLTAHMDDGETHQTVQREASALSTTDGAVLIDAYPSPQRGMMRTQLSYVLDGETAGRNGMDVVASQVDGLALLLGIADPRGLSSRNRNLELWQRIDGSAPPKFLRVMLTTNPTPRSLVDVARHLQGAVRGVGATPDVAALRAQHDLVWWLRHQLLDGEVAAEPSLLVSVWIVHANDEITSHMYSVPPPAPIGFDGPPEVSSLARFAAADAVARAMVVGAPMPQVPDLWLGSSQDLGNLPPTRTEVQMGVARSLPRVSFGAAREDRALWTYDREGGAVAWSDALGRTSPVKAPSVRGVHVDANLPFAVWRDLFRCTEARRWAGLLNVSVPEACVLPEGTSGG